MQQGIYVNKVETLVFIAKTFVVVVVVVVVVVSAVAFAAVGVVGYIFEATSVWWWVTPSGRLRYGGG